MANFTAGQKLRASELNDFLPIMARATADTSKTSNTTLGNVTGLAVAVAASTAYALDGYLAYTGNSTGDIKFAWTIPTGLTGHWGISSDDTTTPGDLKTSIATAYTTVITAGGGSLNATVKGYVLTDTTAGTLQLQFAQNTSNGTATVVKTGSWIRLTKLT